MDAGRKRALERKREAQRIREQSRLPVTPYDGERYRTEQWVPLVYATEKAVYETILLAAGRLTNPQARETFERLVRPLPDGETQMIYASGNEVEFLTWNIRLKWREYEQKHRTVAKEDYIGILRTLLFSMQAHAADRGPQQGYLAFLKEFMRNAGL